MFVPTSVWKGELLALSKNESSDTFCGVTDFNGEDTLGELDAMFMSLAVRGESGRPILNVSGPMDSCSKLNPVHSVTCRQVPCVCGC